MVTPEQRRPSADEQRPHPDVAGAVVSGVRPRRAPGPPPDGEATVVAVLVASDPESIVSSRVDALELDWAGVVGDRHHGLTVPSGSRQARFYPRGTPIRNRRQLTVVSVEECAEVAERLGIPQVRPEWLGANLLVTDWAGLSTLPAGARLLLPGGVGLVCEGVNQPCRLPARVIAEHHPGTDVEHRFGRVAFGRRGIAASVERPGTVRAGAHVAVVLPEQHAFLEV